MDALTLVEDEVRELIRRKGLDPLQQGGEVRRLVEAAVNDYDERSLVGAVPPLSHAADAKQHIYDAVAGFGALQPFLDDPSVEEIWLNAPDQVFVARNGESELTPLVFTQQQVRDLVERMLKSSGRRLDLSSPFVDAALPDGSRLHVVIPDITKAHWAVNIRKFTARASRLEHLVELGSLTPQAARFLGAAVSSGLNILVSGATQAGKTTMLNCLAAGIGSRERVVTVEEIFELALPLRDVVGLQCRQPNLEGAGEIPLRRLVKEALRMRPDRLIVGEVREAESLDMLIALNSGLPGMASVHANSAHDAVVKICTLPLLAGENITAAFVLPTVAACIDLVVHCVRAPNGKRRVGQILSLGRRVENGVIESGMVFDTVDGLLTAQASAMPSPEKFAAAGYNVATLVGDA
ncbi:pilus assembly protein CpaF [Arthrobacter silviterrae]|uniref:CpaF family protein n=1 Tax=Arthrobacter silviterrae TaxID=2026658 RepID=A0ABX0DES3_9MICC|nr:ATPase, T2SS/T4P/T4SS family [Arthrobacter silviterrae]MDQ0277062.1 pilus assembly protein CpaF [Arthrobacter silviterrae]NGN83875.1 CpaF family protein [Arthrobacter silviterrae]